MKITRFYHEYLFALMTLILHLIVVNLKINHADQREENFQSTQKINLIKISDSKKEKQSRHKSQHESPNTLSRLVPTINATEFKSLYGKSFEYSEREVARVLYLSQRFQEILPFPALFLKCKIDGLVKGVLLIKPNGKVDLMRSQIQADKPILKRYVLFALSTYNLIYKREKLANIQIEVRFINNHKPRKAKVFFSNSKILIESLARNSDHLDGHYPQNGLLDPTKQYGTQTSKADCSDLSRYYLKAY